MFAWRCSLLSACDDRRCVVFSARDGDELFSQPRRALAISSLRVRKGEGSKMPNWDRGIKKRQSGKRREKVNLGSQCLLSDSEIIVIRYDTWIALQYRNDSRDSIDLRFTGTICTALLMTHTVSYDMYRVLYDTNFYGCSL
jgi:hypothetical protein